MPTLNSEYYNNQVNELVRYRSSSNVSCGEVRDTVFEYKFGTTVGSVEASGDILKLGRLDPGITVIADEMKVISEGIGGTTVTLTKIGDQQDDDRFSATAAALTAAGTVAVTPNIAATIPPVAITSGVNDIVQVTLGGTLPATAGKRFWLRVRWRPTA